MPLMSEPRVDARVRIEVPVQVVETGSHATQIEMRTLDLSCAGALCRAPAHIPLKSQIRIRIGITDDPQEPAILTDAVVLRLEKDQQTGAVAGSFLVALYFLNLRLVDRQRLQRFVFSQLAREGQAPS